MKKNYTFILLLLLVFGSFSVQAQESKSTTTSKTQEPIIEGLTIYPNPTNSGRIYISTKLSLDKKDTFSFFLDLRLKHKDEEIYTMFESYDINKLDINRIYRYLDKYTNKDCKAGGDDNAGDCEVEDIVGGYIDNEGEY